MEETYRLEDCKWQLAVVDWSLFKKTLDPNDMVDEKILALVDEIESGKAVDYLENGTVVRVCNVYQKDLRGRMTPMATVWVPSRKKYMKNVLEALHPIVDESDMIDIELKFGNGRTRREESAACR